MNNKSRCLWREEQFMLNLLQSTVTPYLSLKDAINDWHSISEQLRENSRKRKLQVENFDMV
jgi:hypothetical protein